MSEIPGTYERRYIDPDPKGYAALEDVKRFYFGNIFYFLVDILGYSDMREHPHFEMADFFANSKGNGSNRTSNIYGFPLEPNPNAFASPDKRRILELAPRNTFKSSVAKGYPVWRWVQDPNRQFLFINYNDRKAQPFLREIKDHLARPQVAKIFGDFCPKGKPREKDAVWSNDSIRLWNPYTEDLAEIGGNMPTGQAVGMGADITGLHCDEAIVDDIVTEKNVDTPDQLEYPIHYMGYVELVVNPHGSIRVNGTRYHFADLYGHLIQKGEFDVYLRGAVAEDGGLYFEERLSWPILRSLERQMSPEHYSCQILNNPINPKDVTFKPDWIDFCMSAYNPPLGEFEKVVIGIDPNRSKNKRSDYCGMFVAGQDKNNVAWVLETVRRRLNTEEFVDLVFSLHERWDPDRILIEANAGQGLFIDLLKKEDQNRNTGLGRVLQGIEHSTRQSKTSRINLLIPYIKRGQMRFSPDMTDLIGELKRYPKEHPDLLDAAEMVMSWLNPEPISNKREKTFEELREEARHRREHDMDYNPKNRNRFKDMFREAMR